MSNIKEEQIINYINNVVQQLNIQYNGIVNEEKLQKTIDMFKDRKESYEDLVSKINLLAKQMVENHLAMKEKRFNPKIVKTNHEEIYDNLEILVKKLNERGIDYQLAGSLCAYLKYGIESSRTHDDIDINLNEKDIDKFREVCEEMSLSFNDNRLSTSRVLKNGIPSGEHEVIATLDNSAFHIGVFCFCRNLDGTVVNKGYYHDEEGNICSRNDTLSPELAKELFGSEQINFRGQRLVITPPEYIYKLKSYTQNEKDKVDLKFMESRIDRRKLARINELSNSHQISYEKISSKDLVFYHGGAEPSFTLDELEVLRKSQKQQNKNNSYVGFYMYGKQDRESAFNYAEYENKRNNTTIKGVLKLILDSNVNVFQMPPFSITRITKEQILELQQRGYDLIAGKMLGKTEYVLINKDKIKHISFESMDMRYVNEKNNAIMKPQISYVTEYEQYNQNVGKRKK